MFRYISLRSTRRIRGLDVDYLDLETKDGMPQRIRRSFTNTENDGPSSYGCMQHDDPGL